jgi:hypothetical protein
MQACPRCGALYAAASFSVLPNPLVVQFGWTTDEKNRTPSTPQ